MFSLNYISSVILFAISTSFTPGPNNFLLLASGMKFGLKKTWGHILGILVGKVIKSFINVKYANIILIVNNFY